jgi:hypothetical protein
MNFFIKKNFNSIEQYLIFLLIFSYFLPPFYLSFRFEHIILYGASIYFFFKRTFNKNYYNFLLKKKYITIFVVLNLFAILGVSVSAARSIIIIDSNLIPSFKYFFSFLSTMDNFIQPVLLIFISTFILRSKEKEKNIRCILFFLILLGGINVLYSFFEFTVIYLDRFCGIRKALEQSASCNFIALIDSIYNSGLYSDIVKDLAFKSNTDPNLLKLNLSQTDKQAAIEGIYFVNSNSVGWVALVNADRLSGIFNMPIQAAIVHGSCIFLTLLFIKNEEHLLKKNILFKHCVYIIFLLNVVGAIIPASKVTFYFTIPALIFFCFFLSNEISFFVKKKVFFYYFLILVMIMSILAATRWNGYNLYWSQIVKLIQVPFSEIIKIRGIFIPEQIITDRHRMYAKSKTNRFTDYETNRFTDYETSKQNFKEKKYKIFLDNVNNSLIKKTSDNFKINKSRSEQLQELLQKFNYLNKENLDNNTKKNSNHYIHSNKKDDLLFIMHYFTGGRLGIEPDEIILLKKIVPFFGFGPLFHINYDNLFYYILFNGGYFSLFFFISALIIIIFYIFKNKNSSKEKFWFSSYLIIFVIFLVASLGAPSYLLNAAVIYFYLPTAIILFRK